MASMFDYYAEPESDQGLDYYDPTTGQFIPEQNAAQKQAASYAQSVKQLAQPAPAPAPAAPAGMTPQRQFIEARSLARANAVNPEHPTAAPAAPALDYNDRDAVKRKMQEAVAAARMIQPANAEYQPSIDEVIDKYPALSGMLKYGRIFGKPGDMDSAAWMRAQNDNLQALLGAHAAAGRGMDPNVQSVDNANQAISGIMQQGLREALSEPRPAPVGRAEPQDRFANSLWDTAEQRRQEIAGLIYGSGDGATKGLAEQFPAVPWSNPDMVAIQRAAATAGPGAVEAALRLKNLRDEQEQLRSEAQRRMGGQVASMPGALPNPAAGAAPASKYKAAAMQLAMMPDQPQAKPVTVQPAAASKGIQITDVPPPAKAKTQPERTVAPSVERVLPAPQTAPVTPDTMQVAPLGTFGARMYSPLAFLNRSR